MTIRQLLVTIGIALTLGIALGFALDTTRIFTLDPTILVHR